MKDKKRDRILNEAIAFIYIMSEDTVSEKQGKKLIKKLHKIKLCNKHFVSNSVCPKCESAHTMKVGMDVMKCAKCGEEWQTDC